MGGLKQPVGQQRFTNVSVVKYRVNGKKFEIAAYSNKMEDFKNGHEKHIEDVLQSQNIYQSVSHGKLAKAEEWQQALGTDNIKDALVTILEKGSSQVNTAERVSLQQEKLQDVVYALNQWTHSATTRRNLTTEQISDLLKQVGFSLSILEPTKKQAQKALEQLLCYFPNEVRRSLAKYDVWISPDEIDSVARLLEFGEFCLNNQFIETLSSGHYSYYCLPKHYKDVENIAATLASSRIVTLGTNVCLEEGLDYTSKLIQRSTKAEPKKPAETKKAAKKKQKRKSPEMSAPLRGFVGTDSESS